MLYILYACLLACLPAWCVYRHHQRVAKAQALILEKLKKRRDLMMKENGLEDSLFAGK